VPPPISACLSCLVVGTTLKEFFFFLGSPSTTFLKLLLIIKKIKEKRVFNIMLISKLFTIIVFLIFTFFIYFFLIYLFLFLILDLLEIGFHNFLNLFFTKLSQTHDHNHGLIS
jgi:hypothetical protein